MLETAVIAEDKPFARMSIRSDVIETIIMQDNEPKMVNSNQI